MIDQAVNALLALAAAVSVAAPGSDDRPVVLTLHPGGYYLYDSSAMRGVDAAFEAQGFDAVAVNYTTGDIEAGWKDVKEVARTITDRPIYAYGESAGGGYAGMLAVKGLVDGAVLLSPLADLTDWGQEKGERFQCTTSECWDEFSPALRPARAPVLQFLPTDDDVVDPAAALDWAERDPLVEAETWPGFHLAPSPQGRPADLQRAGEFFRAQGFELGD